MKSISESRGNERNFSTKHTFYQRILVFFCFLYTASHMTELFFELSKMYFDMVSRLESAIGESHEVKIKICWLGYEFYLKHYTF